MDRGDRDRYFQIGSVYLDIVTPLMRTLLQRHYESKGFLSLKHFLNSLPVRHILFHLRNKSSTCCSDTHNCANNIILHLSMYQWEHLYTLIDKDGQVSHQCHCNYTAKDIELKDIDIPLAGLILFNCCQLNRMDETAIQSLRRIKNEYYSHNSRGAISDTEFCEIWEKLKKCVLQLDSSKDEEFEIIQKNTSQSALKNILDTVMEARAKIVKLCPVLEKPRKGLKRTRSLTEDCSFMEDMEMDTTSIEVNKPNKKIKEENHCIQQEPNSSVTEEVTGFVHSFKPYVLQNARGKSTEDEITGFDSKVAFEDKDERQRVYSLEETVKKTVEEVSKLMKNNKIIELNILEIQLDLESTFQNILQEIDSRNAKGKLITNELKKLQIKFEILNKKVMDASDTNVPINIENNIREGEENYQKLSREAEKISFHVDENKIKGSIEAACKIILKEDSSDPNEKNISHEQSIDIDRLQPRKLMTFDIPKGEKEIHIRGCAILNKKEVCFADRGNNRLIFMTSKGFHKCFSLPCQPADITAIQGNKLAVSLIEQNAIYIINTENMTVETISLNGNGGVSGLTTYQDDMVLRTKEGYFFVNCKGKNVVKRIKIGGTKMPYVACAENRIYFAKWEKNEVHCWDFSGNKIWMYKNESVISNPNGISIDKDGNLYVTGTKSNNVVVISPDGTKCNEILKEENFPIAIDVEKDSKKLLVCSSKSNAVLYSLL